MMNSQLRTLISLLIVFALGALFLWGSSRVLNSVTGAAAPPATPTVPAAIEQPVIAAAAGTGTHVATHRHSHRAVSVHHTHARPTAVPPTPVPSPTPARPAQVFMTETDAATNPATKFPLGLQRLYCWVRISALPPNATYITFAWTKEVANGFLNNVGVQRYPGNVNGSWFPFSVQTAGKYRCDVTANQKLIGSVHFTVG